MKASFLEGKIFTYEVIPYFFLFLYPDFYHILSFSFIKFPINMLSSFPLSELYLWKTVSLIMHTFKSLLFNCLIALLYCSGSLALNCVLSFLPTFSLLGWFYVLSAIVRSLIVPLFSIKYAGSLYLTLRLEMALQGLDIYFLTYIYT